MVSEQFFTNKPDPKLTGVALARALSKKITASFGESGRTMVRCKRRRGARAETGDVHPPSPYHTAIHVTNKELRGLIMINANHRAQDISSKAVES
jgi:hypothetical protein